jgi:hypothetical protein
MRRMLTVAFLSAFLAVVPPAFAQRGGVGGGHAGGGFGGGHMGGGSFGHGFSGGVSSGSFGRSSGFASRSYASAPRFTSTAPARAFTTGNRLPYGVSADRRDGRGGYRSPYRGYGYGYGYPYANSWELLPWDIGYPDFTGYGDYDDSGSPQPSSASVAPPDDGYRQDYAGDSQNYGPQGYGPAYGPGYQDPQPTADDTVANEPELTLIFNDGHTQAIRNYVLTASTVIVLDEAASGHQQRIPLASLNVPATEHAAQQAGLDFSPPV